MAWRFTGGPQSTSCPALLFIVDLGSSGINSLTSFNGEKPEAEGGESGGDPGPPAALLLLVPVQEKQLGWEWLSS